jgi:trehalose-6-phosphatase
MVYELVVPGPGKGDAITQLIRERRLTRVLVAGDDLADDEAFRIVRGLEVDSVLIAVASPEAPSTLVELADISVDSPAELVAFLRELAARI